MDAADVVTRFYAAVAARDLAAADPCFIPDAVWHLPGDSPIAGDHVGRPSIRDRRRVLDVTGCQLVTIVDGRIAEVRGHYSDQEQLDAFWRS